MAMDLMVSCRLIQCCLINMQIIVEWESQALGNATCRLAK